MDGRDDAIGRNGETKDQLDARVRIWKWVLFGVATCLVGAYLVYFGLILGQNAATDADKWGQFGDFVGGLLNPIVAFAAFFWLTESVKLQKLELAATRAELHSAAEAQKELVENGRATIKIAALAALAEDSQNEYVKARSLIESIARNRPPDNDAARQFVYDEDQRHTISLLNYRIKKANAEREEYLSELKRVLTYQKTPE